MQCVYFARKNQGVFREEKLKNSLRNFREIIDVLYISSIIFSEEVSGRGPSAHLYYIGKKIRARESQKLQFVYLKISPFPSG